MGDLLVNGVVILLVILGAVSDMRTKRIPNVLTFPAMIIGVILHTAFSGPDGLIFSILGFLMGLGLYFIPFALGFMGAGDVKLLAAVGALKGWRFALLTALFSAIAGLLVVVIYLLFKGKLFYLLKKVGLMLLRPVVRFLYLSFPKSQRLSSWNVKMLATEGDYADDEKMYVPYGVAIALGALFTLSGVYKDFFSF